MNMPLKSANDCAVPGSGKTVDA